MTARAPFRLDGLSHSDVRAGALRGRRVTVLGLARSGIALARFFARAGASVTVYDARPAVALAEASGALDGLAIRFLLGPAMDPADSWADADLVATSPSINADYPTTEPRLRAGLAALRDRRLSGDGTAPSVVSEADLVLRLCPAPTIGVTGTKGKTTTASLIHAVLAADPRHPALLGGNIGDPLIDRLDGLTQNDRVVIELSELQLPTLSRGTTVAVYTNVTSDHLDRHGSLAAYRRAKRRLAELVDPDGVLVLNADDPVVAAWAGQGSARTLFYRDGPPMPGGVGVVDGWIVADDVERVLHAAGDMPPAAKGVAERADPSTRLMPIDELLIPGRHNVSNALAAVAVGLLFGVPPAAIRAAVGTFQGVEHRLERVAEIDGVRFINDSQGTQPDAVMAALNAFSPPIVLIAGGRDKDVDLSELARVVASRADGAVLIGESADALEALFRSAGLARVERAQTLEDAVIGADRLARERLLARREAGEAGTAVATVLLSPAAASFDMFVDYAARGRAFKVAVAALAQGHGAPDSGNAAR